MNFEEFKKIVEEAKSKHPFWFDSESDPKADNDQIKQASEALGVNLPEDYIDFVKEYGGGYFAFTNIFSVYSNSDDWYIVERNFEYNLPENNFIAISDDEAGGYYGFRVKDGICDSSIAYWDHESHDPIMDRQYDNLFSFIAEIGLKN